MATRVLDKNEARIPFFGDRVSFITGLDPLGLQNPSTQMYSYLLPGLNNVTWRIRNYSFYSWLLTEYAHIVKSDNPKDQRKFIRRAEYIIALMSAHSGIESVSGIEYARKRIDEGLQSFDLQQGTYNEDETTYNTYWQNPGGIFGQYYVGSLRQIGVIEEPVNAQGEFIGIFRRTPSDGLHVSGEDLALAFEENISSKNKSTFLRCINEGSISERQLKELITDFNITRVPEETREHELLLRLLIDVDEPLSAGQAIPSQRKNTIFHLLRFSTQKSGIDYQHDFTMHAYNEKGLWKGVQDDCLYGWYFYQLNEYWQVGCTAILNGCLDFLQEMKGAGWMPLSELIDTCSKKIVKNLVDAEYVHNGNVSVRDVNVAEIPHEAQLFDEIMSSDSHERMTHAFSLILKLFTSNERMLFELRNYVTTKGIGDDVQGVLSYYSGFSSKASYSIDKFVGDFLLRNILSRHQNVAYSKMGGGSQSTQKFVIEEGYVRQIGNFKPSFTSPRIRNVLTFLTDLGLLSGNYVITKKGTQFLRNSD